MPMKMADKLFFLAKFQNFQEIFHEIITIEPLSATYLKSITHKGHLQKEMIEFFFSVVKLCKILDSELEKILQEILVK